MQSKHRLGRAFSVGIWLIAPLCLGACTVAPSEPAESESTAAATEKLFVLSTVLWPDGLVPVCWENPASDNVTARGWVENFVVNSWGAVANVSFYGWGPCTLTSRGVRIRISDENPYTLGLGTQMDGVSNGMVLNFTFENWSPTCRFNPNYCIRLTAVHEFGHALGFDHEQNRPDTPPSCTLADVPQGDTPIGAWDLYSVMNYCNPTQYNDGYLSPTDIYGAREAYGEVKRYTLAAGKYHSLHIGLGNLIYAWGRNDSGQLGDGTYTNQTRPVPIDLGYPVIAVAGGESFSLALLADGTVRAWGLGTSGQLGQGSFTSSAVPVVVVDGTGTPLHNVSAITAGDLHGAALLQDGTLWSWGANGYSQLGNGTSNRAPRAYAARVYGINQVDQVAAGGFHTLALKHDRTVWGWGLNAVGQLGNGTVDKTPIPISVPGLSDIIEVRGGWMYSMAVQANGSVWTWGSNWNGELGIGTLEEKHQPVLLTTVDSVVAGAAGGLHTLVRRVDGSLYDWGANHYGQLGNGTWVKSLIPYALVQPVHIARVATGYHHSLVVEAQGTRWGWGYNQYGQVGDGTTVSRGRPVLVP